MAQIKVPYQKPTHFHSFIIVPVHNMATRKNGWRIVGLWGDEEKREGNRIGPTFEEDKIQDCENLCDELQAKYGLPVPIDTIVAHFGACI